MHTRTAPFLARLCAVASLVGTLGAAPASADDTREYRGTWDGRPVSVLATCAGDTCELTAAQPFEWVLGGLMDEVWQNPVTTTGGKAVITSPDTCGSAAAGRAHHDITLAIDLTPDRLTATWTEKTGRREVGDVICWSNTQPVTYVAAAVAATASPTTVPADGQPTSAPGGSTVSNSRSLAAR